MDSSVAIVFSSLYSEDSKSTFNKNLTNPFSFQSFEVRQMLHRIPEVSILIRQAQAIIDQLTKHLEDKESLQYNLISLMQSDEECFASFSSTSKLLLALVQTSLFHRWRKYNNAPSYLIGEWTPESALSLCSKQVSLFDFVLNSELLKNVRESLISETEMDTAIANESEQEQSYAVYIINRSNDFANLSLQQLTQKDDLKPVDTAQYDKLRSGPYDIRSFFMFVSEQLPVDILVNIGPGEALFENFNRILNDKQIAVHDSISCDQKLDWFWRELKMISSQSTEYQAYSSIN